VGTAVDQHAHGSVGVPGHDHRLPPHARGEEVARIPNLTLVADEKPGAAEDPIHLEVEERGIGVHRPVDTVGLDQTLDGLNVHRSVL
jgi:hypothetical protein